MSGNIRRLHGKDAGSDKNAEEPLQGKAATQNRILQAAGALFLERGYENTTIADVAEMAGVSRATVFWHFSDKAGLFREALFGASGPIPRDHQPKSRNPRPRRTTHWTLYRLRPLRHPPTRRN